MQTDQLCKRAKRPQREKTPSAGTQATDSPTARHRTEPGRRRGISVPVTTEAYPRSMSSHGTPASKFLETGTMPWRPFDEAPGVAFRVLKTHPPGGGATLLLRFDPGSSYPVHRHPEGEEYYVLEGELIDGSHRYAAGTYAWHGSGTVHAPRSETGAVVLVFVPGGIEIVGRS